MELSRGAFGKILQAEIEMVGRSLISLISSCKLFEIERKAWVSPQLDSDQVLIAGSFVCEHLRPKYRKIEKINKAKKPFWKLKLANASLRVRMQANEFNVKACFAVVRLQGWSLL